MMARRLTKEQIVMLIEALQGERQPEQATLCETGLFLTRTNGERPPHHSLRQRRTQSDAYMILSVPLCLCGAPHA